MCAGLSFTRRCAAIVDLSRALGWASPSLTYATDHRRAHRAALVGLLVDAVSEILPSRRIRFSDTGRRSCEAVKMFIKGIIAFDGRMIAGSCSTAFCLNSRGGSVTALAHRAQRPVACRWRIPLTAADFSAISAVLYGLRHSSARQQGGFSLFAAGQAPAHARSARFREYVALISILTKRGTPTPAHGANHNVTRFFREPHHFDHLVEEVPGARAEGRARRAR